MVISVCERKLRVSRDRCRAEEKSGRRNARLLAEEKLLHLTRRQSLEEGNGSSLGG